jgi:hypothetical protein
MSKELHGPGIESGVKVEFSSAKKAEFEKNLTPEISLVIEESGKKMFDPHFDKDGAFEGYIVGAVTGVTPQLIIAKPNEDGSEMVDTLNIPALLRHTMTEEERALRLVHLKKLHGGLYDGKPQTLDIRIVDLSAWMEQLAELVAENKLRAYMNESGFIKKAFAHIDEDAYRRKFYLDTLHAIQSNRNVKASLEARVFGRGAVESSDPHVKETLAKFDEVLQHFAEGLHDEEERGDKFIADPELNKAASALFVEYATGAIKDRAEFENRVESEIIPFMSGKSFAKGGLSTISEKENRMHASNLWHWAETYKEQVAQMTKDAQEKYGEKDPECIKRYVKGMLKLDLNIELSKRGRDLVNRDPYGKVEPGQQKVTKLNRAERAVSFLQNNIGWSPANKVLGAVIANPIAMGIVGAIAGRAGIRAAATLAVGTAAAPFLAAPVAVMGASLAGGTFAAALFAKIRATKEVKQDRGMVARDRALGRTSGGPRAAEMEKQIHEMESADKILEQLRGVTGEEKDPAARVAALNIIADVRARLAIRLEYAKDTIRVSAEEGEKELSLGNAIDAIKREFKRIGPKMGEDWNDAALLTLIDDKKIAMLGEIKKSDEKFADYLRKESNKKMMIGAAMGLAGGAIMGGVHAVAHSDMFHDSMLGRGWNATAGRALNAAGRAVDDGLAATKRLFSFLTGGSNTPVPNAAAMHGGIFDFMDQPRGTHDIPFGKGTMHLPENRFFINDGNGNGHIVTEFGRQVSPSFHINPDGSVLEPSGTGEWKQLITHTTQTIQGQEYSPYLESHEFANASKTLVKNFDLPKNLQIIEDSSTHTFQIQDPTGKVLESGLEIGPDGKLTEASGNLLRTHGWVVKESGYVPADGHSYDKKGLAEYLRKNFGQSKAHRLDWHDNGTPMRKVGGTWVSTYVDADGVNHDITTKLKPEAAEGWVAKHVGGRWTGADGKELQLKLAGDPEHRVLSLKEMIQQSIRGKHNLDGSIDDKFGDISSKTEARDFAEAAKNFKLRVFVGNNYTGSGESFELPVGPDGELHLDRSDELYGVLFDKEGHLKATVEAVIPESDGSGYHTLATAVRHGDGTGFVANKAAYFQMSHPQTDTLQHDYIYNESLPQEFLPPVKTEDIPLIFPLPVTPRRPMEVPTINKEDKMSGRRISGKPLVRPPYRSNEELSRAMVKEADFDDVLTKEAQRRRRIGAGTESLDAEIMEAAVAAYAISNNIKLTESRTRELSDALAEARAEEMRKPLEWDKAFVISKIKPSAEHPKGMPGFESASGVLNSLSDLEKRLAFANPRPKKIYATLGPDTGYAEADVRSEFKRKFEAYGVEFELVAPAPKKRAPKKN